MYSRFYPRYLFGLVRQLACWQRVRGALLLGMLLSKHVTCACQAKASSLLMFKLLAKACASTLGWPTSLPKGKRHGLSVVMRCK